jgi:hypothetical protein
MSGYVRTFINEVKPEKIEYTVGNSAKQTASNVSYSASKIYDQTGGAQGFKLTTFTNPNDVLFGPELTENLLWIVLRAYPVNRLSGNVRAPLAFSKETLNDSKDLIQAQKGLGQITNGEQFVFNFLAPPELMESLSHSWDSYESFQSQLAGTVSQFNAAAHQVLSMAGVDIKGKSFSQIVSEIKGKMTNLADSIKNNKNIGQTFTDIITGLNKYSMAGDVQNYRVDTPLQYKGSERRKWDFTLNLFNTVEGRNEENVVKPVKYLEMLSCPAYADNTGLEKGDKSGFFNSDIALPYLFSISTTPIINSENKGIPLIVCDLAVLKEVQPTWRGPWVMGYPSRCELRLSFTEYRPIERRLIYGMDDKGDKGDAIVKVSSLQTTQAP